MPTSTFKQSSLRVSLRRPEPDDAEAFCRAMGASSELHGRWVSPPLTREQYQRQWEGWQSARDDANLLICKQTEAVAGFFRLSQIFRGGFQNAYLGYYAAAPFAGQGVMHQGMVLMLQRAFEVLDLHRIEANIQPQNLPSIGLVRKTGFRLEGFSPRYLKIDGEWRDHERWAITREEWPPKGVPEGWILEGRQSPTVRP